MMDFPLIVLLDEHACYRHCVALLHPDGLACPRCGADNRPGIHRRHREPALDDQCGLCRCVFCVFNAFTGTPLQGIRRQPAQLARVLGCDRKHLLQLRPSGSRAMPTMLGLDRNPRDDEIVEADEVYVHAGEKQASRIATRPIRRGHGSFAGDRPLVAGGVGRRSVRSVWKWIDLAQYVAIFQWDHNLKRATDDFLRALLGVRPSIASAS